MLSSVGTDSPTIITCLVHPSKLLYLGGGMFALYGKGQLKVVKGYHVAASSHLQYKAVLCYRHASSFWMGSPL